MRLRSAISLWVVLGLACADDEGGGGSSTSVTTRGDEAGASTMSGESSTSIADGSTTTGSPDSSESGSGESSAGTTGGVEDPAYPSPGAAGCPGDTALVQLPGGAVCGPFCAGAEAPCPEPASGDAIPTCTPFEQDGGSGTPCTEHGDCPNGEACSAESTCSAVAFWGCRLVCESGETCSDGMVCLAGVCGYGG